MPTSFLRRLLQFRLRGLLIAISLVAIWLGWHMSKVNRQRAAVERILQLGGTVTYDYAMMDTGHEWKVRPDPEPNRIAAWLGIDHFYDLVMVEFADPEFEGRNLADADLQLIGQVSSVTSIDLFHAEITDTGLRHLSSLPNLRYLTLMYATIDDDALEIVAGHENLVYLNVMYTKTSDVGLMKLGNLTELSTLDVAGTHLSDAGLEHFSRLKKLRSLSLINTKVSPKGVERLRMELPDARISFSTLGP